MTWVPSPLCPRSKCHGSNFKNHLSDTFIDYDIPIKVSYGSGSLKGSLVSDFLTSDQTNPS